MGCISESPSRPHAGRRGAAGSNAGAYSAPAKVILFGEHFVVHGARAILCAVDRRVRVETRRRNDGMVSVRSSLASAECTLDGGSSHPLLKPFHHMAKSLGVGGVDVDIQSRIPPGAGLGSSSACCVAAAGSLLQMRGVSCPQAILDAAVGAERVMQPDSSGADCAACMYGGIIEYVRDPNLSIDTIGCDEPLGLGVVVANSGIPHSTEYMVAKVKQLAQSRPVMFARILDEADSLARRALDAILDRDIPALGRLASQNQVLLERIGVSNETLDEMVRIADEHSYGSKITGAGGGGCIVALTDDTGMEPAMSSLASAGYDTFGARIGAGGRREPLA